MKKIRFYHIADEYIDYCREFDTKVMSNKADIRKFNRKFIGIILEINEFKYFAPLSSFKPKHLKMNDNVDFIKISDKNGEYAVINLNNMLPVPDVAVIEFDIDNELDYNYQQLLKKEYFICQDKKKKIFSNAEKIYKIVTKHKTKRFVERCCNFKLLEEKCKQYTK